MAAIQLPCTLFQTRKWINDYGAADMRCGDLTEAQLKKHFYLIDVSARVNPYTLTKITAFNQPQSRFYGMRGQGEKVTRQECAKILFDEFRHLSQPFAIYGPYRYLIGKMIDHMQYGNGFPFHNLQLNSALREQILTDKSRKGSLTIIRDSLRENIDWKNGSIAEFNKEKMSHAISDSMLPKYTRWRDHFNGLGITVHDIHSMQIILQSLRVESGRFHATIHYKAQDHFGLDNHDMLDWRFHHFHFFRIWFVLQRYVHLAHKPFMTNMEATVEISGERPQ